MESEDLATKVFQNHLANLSTVKTIVEAAKAEWSEAPDIPPAKAPDYITVQDLPTRTARKMVNDLHLPRRIAGSMKEDAGKSDEMLLTS